MERKTRIYILRHGETLWNREGNRYCGSADIALSAEGRLQAEVTADFFRNLQIDAVYSSPLQRAHESARIIAERLSLGLFTDVRLRELDFGAWEGKTATTIAQDDSRLWSNWLHDASLIKAGGTGESAAEVYSRAEEVIEELRERHLGASVLLVGHNTLNRIWLAGKLGMPIANYRLLSQDNMNVTIVELSPHSCKLIQLNGIEHLRASNYG